MGIENKSVGILIDELFTTDHKCWEAQEHIMDLGMKMEKRLEYAVKAQELNKKRNELIRAIDKALGQDSSPTEKTY